MNAILIKSALINNENSIFKGDIYIENGIIIEVAENINFPHTNYTEINAEGLMALPGLIDDQVHFREPGLTHKATIASESAAAVAGGVTSFMEMPNVKPATLTQELLEEKYQIAANCSPANYSFYMGVSNENYEEIIKTNPNEVCGIKVFMGSSTGNMLVDDLLVLEKLFANAPTLIATHCEDEHTIAENLYKLKTEFPERVFDASFHPVIRDVAACYNSSSMAVALAKKHNTKLHILHITTAKELSLFRNDIPLKEKKITSEACVHHLWYSADDYAAKGNLIKCNPAIKTPDNREEIWKAVNDGRIDVIATDHAPHTWDEKSQVYDKALAGLPLVQHSLLMLLESAKMGRIAETRIPVMTAHNVAELFNIKGRGYLKPSYYADIVLVNPKATTFVDKEQLLYHCGWSPLEGHTFPHRIEYTLVNGEIAYSHSTGVNPTVRGKRLQFDRV